MENRIKGREKKQLGAASIILELPNEPAVRHGQRWLIRDSPHEFGNFSQQHDGRGRIARLLRGQADPGVDVTQIGGGATRGGGGGESKDNIIFAESLISPGIPVVYRPPEERLTNPDRLNLDRRNLFICPILEGEEQLRLLNLQHNSIPCIQHFGSLRRLVFLDLYDNKIEDICGLNGLHSLRVLMLGRNRISRITGLEALMKLDVLDLHGNLIKYIDNIGHLCHLRVLNLASNHITIIDDLSGLQSLAELNLRRNKITHFDCGSLPLLQRLFLSHNLIESFDDISSTTLCLSLNDLSIDSNPLANNPDHRNLIISYLNHLDTLNQCPVSEEERKEALLAARQEEIKLNELQKQLKLMEQRESLIESAKEEWEARQVDPTLSAGSTSYIENKGHSLLLYGGSSLDIFKANRLPVVTHLTLYYMEFSEEVDNLSHIKESLPMLQHLDCQCLNLSTLLDLRTLCNCLPSSLISLTITSVGNPVTNHPFYTHWITFLLPRVSVNGLETSNQYLFTPYSQFINTCGEISEVDDPVTREKAIALTKDIQQKVHERHKRKIQFDQLWPDLIKKFVKEAVL